LQIDITNKAQKIVQNAFKYFFCAHVKLKIMADKFTIGLVQMKCMNNAEENLTRAIGKIREAAARGAQIISLHELFLGEYFCRTEDAQLFNLAQAVPGPATEKLAQVAKEKKVALVVSLFERRAPGVYHNSCAVLDADGSFLGKYRKMHIPDDPLYYEKFYFAPGDLGFPNFDTKYARVGVQICWDQWYPEGSPLSAALRLFFTPPASAGTRTRRRRSAPRSLTPGAPSSVATPSPMVSTSP
jgi:N-carbamoylputrescine amidase